MISRIACVVALVLLTQPARADWQYTKWGMTVDQVKAAGAGKVGPLPVGAGNQNYNDGVALLAASYSTGPYIFMTYFVFSNTNGGLNHVHLLLQSAANCSLLINDLTGKYGTPTDDSMKDLGMQVLEWRDTVAENLITFVGSQQSGGNYHDCDVQYRPLGGEGGSGL